MNRTETEYAGFVKNLDTNEYEMLFSTFISDVLAKNRAIETAKNRNRSSTCANYDTNDIIVKQRKAVSTWSEWETIPDKGN